MNLNLKLKTREKIMLGAAAAVVLYFAIDFLAFRPMEKEIKARQAKLKVIEEKMNAAVNTIPELQTLRTRVQEKNRLLEISRGKVVGQEQIRVFLKQLASESSRLKLEITSVSISPEGDLPVPQPGAGAPEEKKEGAGKVTKFKQISAQVNLTGPYEGVRDYLLEVQQLPLFMEVDQIQVQAAKEKLPLVQLSFRPTFYLKGEAKP